MIKAEFIKSATVAKEYYRTELPEIAFAGRSNCGKSSLINTVVNKKNLVKVGKTPGKTKLINFFEIDYHKKHQLILTDLPGYGFAKVTMSEKESWRDMVSDYITRRFNLKICYLLLDCRRVPSDEDLMMIDFCKHIDRPLKVIVTKIDKLSNSELQKQLSVISKTTGYDKNSLLPFSSLKRVGIKGFWEQCLSSLFEDYTPDPTIVDE